MHVTQALALHAAMIPPSVPVAFNGVLVVPAGVPQNCGPTGPPITNALTGAATTAC